MSRYLLLVLLNVPFVFAGLSSAVVSYKMHNIRKRKYYFRIALWLIILFGLIFAEPIYTYLFNNNLTDTEPLSLFDVIQITGIVFTLLIASRAYARSELVEKRLHQLHQQISINESTK